MRDGERALDTRANQALALYAVGKTKDAIKMMENIVKKRQVSSTCSLSREVSVLLPGLSVPS